MSLTGNLMMGYDTWLSPSGSPSQSTEERQSGTALTGEAALRYFRGRTQRSISFDGRASMNGYSGIDAEATLGGAMTFTAGTNLGRVTHLRFSQDVDYVPTLVLGAPELTSLDLTAPVPDVAAVSSGYLDQRSWSSNSVVNLDRRWTSRQTTLVAAAYSSLTYLDDLGADTRTRFANLIHSWSVSRTSSLRGLYSISDADLESGGVATPMTNQTIDFSFSYDRRLSPTRQLQITGGGGATHVSTLNAVDHSNLSYWMPSGSGSFSWDVGRSWSLAGDYSRSANVLQGVSLTTFATDSASTSVSGLVNSRIETSFSATYSNGHSGGADTTGRFENYSGSMQLLYAISRCCAMALNYDYFVYRFQNVPDLPSQFPPSFDRQAVWVGFSIWLPLYGTYADGGSVRAPRRH
jgi:hypothetical protein